MKGVMVHGVLLALALLVGYQTWTRDPTRSTAADEVPVWRGSVDRVSSLTFTRPDQILTIEAREANGERYLWGSVQRGRSADDTSQAPRTIDEFPVGERGTELIERVASLAALRDLGVLTDSLKVAYELVDPQRRLRIAFRDRTRELLLGGNVFGGGHRYALDPENGHGYVISSDILRQLEGGQGLLRQTRLHDWELRDVASVTVQAGSATRRMLREGEVSVTGAMWTSPETGEPDQTFANFMDRIQRLAAITYEASLSSHQLERRVRVEFFDARNRTLGFVDVFRAPGETDGFEYYILTEETRVVARTHPSLGERLDEGR